MQDEQSSPAAAAHVPSPQPGHTPQSLTQLPQLSFAGSHVPSPHEAHNPQSISQLEQLSLALHV
jgi:hypothetical protein